MRTETDVTIEYKQLQKRIEDCEKTLGDFSKEELKRNPKTYESIQANKLQLERQKYVFEWVLGIADEY